MEDIHRTMEMNKEPFIKTEFKVESVKYNWTKQEIKCEEDDVRLQYDLTVHQRILFRVQAYFAGGAGSVVN